MANYTFNPTDGASTPKNQWTKAVDSPTTANKIITIPTTGKYLDRDIKITINKLGGAAGTITMTKGSGSVTGSNVTFSETNNGISVIGSGSVSATAKVTTAGYAPQTDSFATGSSTTSNTQSKYISGVTLNAPTSGTNSFSITLPDIPGGTKTFTFKVDSQGNSWVE